MALEECDEDTAVVISELTEIALEEAAFHQRHPMVGGFCGGCGQLWPCGLRRWSLEWLYGALGRAEVLRMLLSD